jgi:hypothetical protein
MSKPFWRLEAFSAAAAEKLWCDFWALPRNFKGLRRAAQFFSGRPVPSAFLYNRASDQQLAYPSANKERLMRREWPKRDDDA